MFKLPEGEYTLAIDFFPPSTTNLSVSVVSTSLNINQQATKLFVNYSRSIVRLHKWSITLPKYIYIDVHCQGTASSPTQEIGYMIVYGVKGSQNDVDSSVYDTAYVIENGKMVLQTDLNMNGHLLRSAVHHINGFLDSKKRGQQINFERRRNHFVAGWSDFDEYCCLLRVQKLFGWSCQRNFTQNNIFENLFLFKNFFTGNLGTSRVFSSQRGGSFETINPNYFEVPSSGLLAIDLNIDACKSYGSIIFLVEYRTSA